ncbi:MAG: MBG domain-containing protein [Bacteroidales bacterium]|nr:MBG domain-containing protein [Bacteroidales bacterium]
MLYSLDSLGFDLLTEDPLLSRATGWVEIGDLSELNFFTALYYARPVYPGVSNYIVPATGLTKSQGDFAMHSDFARLGFDIDGSGVKIGVLSNSYNTRLKANNDVSNGDLPGLGNPKGYTREVEVLKDIVPSHGVLSDEGRAMLQIVHDIAPGAELAFRTGYLGELDMALGIRELANAGSDVIVDDLSYITEPFFRDGVISVTIDSVVSEGVTFFSSAGNFGRASYEADFSSAEAPSTINGTAHDFDGGDIFQSVLLPEGEYTLVLQWDDHSDPTMNTTTTDLDIFLSDDIGFSLLGFNRENVGGFPIEVVPFSVVGDSVTANVVIARAAGEVPVHFKYILFRGGSQFQMLEYGEGGSSTIVGHPNAAGAISVGAVRFDKNPTYNPEEYPVPVIMSFSSVGGTPVNGVVRDKPDITAPNGVNTTVDLGNGDWNSSIDPDTLFPNFFGTSAASPHTAGVAALIMEAKLKFDSVSLVNPETIRALLKETAIDGDDPGVDLVSGSGFIQAHKAIMSFANPSPYVENLILASEGGVPGTEITPFSFTITGDFFTDSTQVWFRGEALDTGVVVVDESTISVVHGGFIGNPGIQVYTPPISESQVDGGFSEEVYFSDPLKQRVIITANNQTKKYGEALDDKLYTAQFMVVTVDEDSLTLEEAVSGGVMLQDEADRLSDLSYAVPAGDNSDAGQYIIIPALFPEADTANPAEIDLSISERFILEFVNGSLTIEKLALTITPVDTRLVYGEKLPAEGFRFLYQIGDSSVLITSPDSLLQMVQNEHTAALSNEIGLVRGVALVNGIPVIRGVALVNGVTMLRGVALVNGLNYVRGTALVNGSPLSLRGTALVNESTINDNSNSILVFDATEIGDTTENVGFTPISFITGTTVGRHWIVPGTFVSNNFEISYGLGTLTIDPADLTIMADDKSKTYGGDDPGLTYQESGLLGEDTIVGALIREEGDFAGEYAILQGSVTAGENYSIRYDSAIFTIDPASLIIRVSASNKVYDGTRAAEVTLSDNRLAGGELDISYSSALFEDKQVGELKNVTVLGLSLSGANAGNYTANVSASGTDADNYLANFSAETSAEITPREVSVTPYESILYIMEGDPLPVFAFIYNGWIPGDAGNEGYTVLRDADGAAYDPSSEESAGTYTVTPVPSNGNYYYTYETGTLYVNPYGPGTRAVKPVLNCIEELSPGYFVANFEYKNENDVTVYIPLGDDNLLTGSGIDRENSDPVPSMFNPGGGSFRVFFDGTELSWTVNSRDGDQKVSNAANANSSSTKCKNNQKSAAVSSGIQEEPPAGDELLAYPNPVTSKVYLSMKDIQNYKMVSLYDFSGRSFPITSIDKRNDKLEIDMEQLSAGHYLIRIVMEDGPRVVQIDKK